MTSRITCPVCLVKHDWCTTYSRGCCSDECLEVLENSRWMEKVAHD